MEVSRHYVTKERRGIILKAFRNQSPAYIPTIEAILLSSACTTGLSRKQYTLCKEFTLETLAYMNAKRVVLLSCAGSAPLHSALTKSISGTKVRFLPPSFIVT